MLCEPLDYAECECKIHKKPRYRELTILLLDCWQREYDERPYENFQITMKFFESRMRRAFSESDWSVLIEFLQLRDLRSVKISYIPLPDFKNEDLTRDLVEALSNVEAIQLRGVTLPVSFLKEFHRMISKCKVESLALNENELTCDHLLLLRCILVESTTVMHLNVAGCRMNENTFPILADGVHKCKNIECLDISRLCLMTLVSIFECCKFVNTVAQLVWQNKLTVLRLRCCSLNGYDMEPITEYLALPMNSLLVLDLQGNNIASHGTDLLFKALTRSNNLRNLNIGSNNLGEKGGEVIARQLACSNLRILDITHNHIPKEIMFEILVAVKKPCELKVLRMFGNEFDVKTAVVLKRLLRAMVFNQDHIDVTYTWDYIKDELCVIPAFSSGRIHT